eukprot:Skav221120  [mRNA]  locus=scaffold233:310361:311124:- [translate_table: standard]
MDSNSKDFRRLTSCVGYAKRTASKMQLWEVKKQLSNALRLLVLADGCHVNPGCFVSVSDPVTPLDQDCNTLTDGGPNLPVDLIHVVQRECSAALASLVGQIQALQNHSEAMSHRTAQVEQQLQEQHCRAERLLSDNQVRLAESASQLASLRLTTRPRNMDQAPIAEGTGDPGAHPNQNQRRAARKRQLENKLAESLQFHRSVNDGHG